jgi:simple sugar transport system substrate-binding protein
MSDSEFFFISHGPTADPFWAAVVEGMETASSLYGVQSHYTAHESYDGDPGDIVRRILSEEDPDGLAVTLTDPVRMEGPVRRAIERENLPVVVVNVPDDRSDEERIPYRHYVGMDERACGERLARATLDRSHSVERALVVVHEPGHTGLERRVEGLRSVLSARDVALQTVERRDRAAIRDAVAESQGANPAVDTYFSLGPHATVPMFEYFRRNELLDDISFAVTDGLVALDAAEKYIRQEKITCSVEQDPFLQGFLPVSKLFELAEGSRPMTTGTERYMMGPDVVDKYSVDKELQNQIIREELIGSLDQLNDEEKATLISQLNAKFEEHQSMSVVGAQVVATLIPHLL